MSKVSKPTCETYVQAPSAPIPSRLETFAGRRSDASQHRQRVPLVVGVLETADYATLRALGPFGFVAEMIRIWRRLPTASAMRRNIATEFPS